MVVMKKEKDIHLPYDAIEAADIYAEALRECIEHGLDPRAVFPAALTTVLIALFENSHSDKDALFVAHQCIANAMVVKTLDKAVIH